MTARYVTSLLLVLGGCMKIYPDPELPDIEVTWFPEDCREGTGDVALTLTGIETPTFHAEATVACAAMKSTFVDLARERYKVEGTLRTAAGDTFAHYDEEIDLRNGLDERSEMYFGAYGNVRVAWAFDMGATCESLAVDYVTIEFTSPEFPDPYGGLTALCEDSPLFGSFPEGVYTVVAHAESHMETVAISPAVVDIEIGSFDTLTDVGTLVLSPCGDSCP